MAGAAEIAATSYEYREKKPMDAISDNQALVYMLKKKGNLTTVPGGRELFEDIRIAQNGAVQNIDPTEEIQFNYNDTLSYFSYTPKVMVVPVIITDYERAQNGGDAEFLNLFEQREIAGEDSMMNKFESQLQGDGTGSGGKDFAGVQTYISKTPTLGTYGGLSRVTYSAIRNISVDAPTTYTGATDSSNIESRIRRVKNQIIRQGSRLFGLAGSDYYNSLCDAASAKQRVTQNQELLKLNFQNIEVDDMTVVLANGRVFSGATRIPADRIYMMNLDNFKIKMYKGYNFQPVQKRVSTNQLLDISLTVGIGQFTCNSAGLSAVMWDS
jgi:hypothetical protein